MKVEPNVARSVRTHHNLEAQLAAASGLTTKDLADVATLRRTLAKLDATDPERATAVRAALAAELAKLGGEEQFDGGLGTPW